LVSSDKGYNPLKWDCEKQGCFNKKKRPKIEVFCGCFPRKINFGDVDGLVELNGRGLLLEWKDNGGIIPTGQKIAYEKLSTTGILTTVVVIGNPETMECRKYRICFKGKWHEYKDADLDSVKSVIKKWCKWAEKGFEE